MPKSKRSRVVHLTKTDRKDKEHKRQLFANVQAGIDQYQYAFVFAVDNMRNTYMKDVRNEFSDSRLFFGKTKVMALALGSNPETSYSQNLYKLSPHLTGSVGLLLTNRSPESIISHFNTYTPLDFARAGTVAPRSFSIPNGIVYSRAGEIPMEHDEPVSHTIEPALRKLGVPTRLIKGKVTLELVGDEAESGYVVCREGETLDSRQTTLLKMFGIAVAEFKIEIVAFWEKESGEVKVVGEMEE